MVKLQDFVYFCILYDVKFLLMLLGCNCKHAAKINSHKIVLLKIFHFLNTIHTSY